MITQHLNKENTRWVFIPNFSPDIWTGAGYRKQGNNNGISLTRWNLVVVATRLIPILLIIKSLKVVAPQPKKQPPILLYQTPSVPPVTVKMFIKKTK
ncbi:adhesin [Mycoplasmoides genitalium]|nr:adhesin [Mycoplasmoides genitalium]